MISGREHNEYLSTSKYSTLITSSNNMQFIPTIYRNYEKIFTMKLKNKRQKATVLHNVNAHLDINKTAKFKFVFLNL